MPPFKQHHSSAIPFIRGLFCKHRVTSSDFKAHRFLMLDSGTTIGTVQIPGSNIPEIGVFVHFPKAMDINPNFRELATLLHQGATYGTTCRNNGAHKQAGLVGIMKVLGWRSAFDPSPWGLYVAPIEIQKDPIKLAAWEEYVGNIHRIQAIFNEEFTRIIVAKLAREAQDFVAEFKLPAFGETTTDTETHAPSLGSNFTISFGGFHNQPHIDNDAFRYVFSIYIFVDQKGNLVTDRTLIEACMEGGHFLWPDLHLGLDTSKCNGVVLFIWRGTHERHCTMESKIFKNGVTRYGTSVQVNSRLLARNLAYQKKQAEWELEMEVWRENGEMGDAPVQPEQPTGL
ncbi:hypothetical protein BDV93DRAFT_556890 [Ceratobasidium sp. AG-I]|nr:hypothetical protein BDV93DRAFT_556890 [Ceratobasidium sp. AG-I]